MQTSERVLGMLLKRHPILSEIPKYQDAWSYDIGVVLQGVRWAYQESGDDAYLKYIQKNIDVSVTKEGEIRGYNKNDNNSDMINNGKLLLFLYQNTGEGRYLVAANQLFSQISRMPRTRTGGFWHKGCYPQQMWLDGLYMVEPFYAEYVVMQHRVTLLEDIVLQFELVYEHTLIPEKGLLCHAWDAAHQQAWADPKTGRSPHSWGRAMGWYMMALVDTYEILIVNNPGHAERLKQLFLNVYPGIKRARDHDQCAWYQVLDVGKSRGNYLEASASSMFTYAIAKAIRLGMLASSETTFLKTSYQGLLNEFVFSTNDGGINLVRNCEVAGLGGVGDRDGSFVYYISEPIITNDLKGLGAFLQASVEYELITG